MSYFRFVVVTHVVHAFVILFLFYYCWCVYLPWNNLYCTLLSMRNSKEAHFLKLQSVTKCGHVVVENIRSDNSYLEIQIRSNSLLILLNNNINKDMYMFNKLEVYRLVGIYITKQLLKYQYLWQMFNLLSNNITCQSSA